MDSKQVGFTGKAVTHSSSYSIELPGNTVKSLEIENGDLLNLEIRNMQGEKVSLTRKVMGQNPHLKVYIPKNSAEKLGLTPGSLVDVFLSKD